MSKLSMLLEQELKVMTCSIHHKKAKLKIKDVIVQSECCCEKFQKIIEEKTADIIVNFKLDQIRI